MITIFPSQEKKNITKFLSSFICRVDFPSTAYTDTCTAVRINQHLESVAPCEWMVSLMSTKDIHPPPFFPHNTALL